MDGTIKARRTAQAYDRITAAVMALAEQHGVSTEAFEIVDKVPHDVKPLYRLEAAADVLDAIVSGADSVDEPESDEKPKATRSRKSAE